MDGHRRLNMEALSEVVADETRQRVAALAVVSNLLAQVDAPHVSDATGSLLAKALYKYCKAADTIDLFDLSMSKPHFRRWWTLQNNELLLDRVRNAITQDSYDLVKEAMEDLVDLSIERRTKFAMYCIKQRRYQAWAGVVAAGPIAPTLEYFQLTMAPNTIPHFIFVYTLEQLVKSVPDIVSRTEAMAIIASCQVAASGKEDFADVNARCNAAIAIIFGSSNKRERDEEEEEEEEEEKKPSKPARIEAVKKHLVFDANARSRFSDIWTVLHEREPALFTDERKDRTSLSLAMQTAFGPRVRTNHTGLPAYTVVQR